MPINYNTQDPAAFYERRQERKDEKFRNFLNFILGEKVRRREFKEKMRQWEAEHGLREREFGLDVKEHELDVSQHEETVRYHDILGKRYDALGKKPDYTPSSFIQNAKFIQEETGQPIEQIITRLLDSQKPPSPIAVRGLELREVGRYEKMVDAGLAAFNKRIGAISKKMFMDMTTGEPLIKDDPQFAKVKRLKKFATELGEIRGKIATETATMDDIQRAADIIGRMFDIEEGKWQSSTGTAPAPEALEEAMDPEDVPEHALDIMFEFLLKKLAEPKKKKDEPTYDSTAGLF